MLHGIVFDMQRFVWRSHLIIQLASPVRVEISLRKKWDNVGKVLHIFREVVGGWLGE